MGFVGFVSLPAFQILVMLSCWQAWCFLYFDFQTFVLKNSAKVWKLLFLLFLTGVRWLESFSGLGGWVVLVCVHVQSF